MAKVKEVDERALRDSRRYNIRYALAEKQAEEELWKRQSEENDDPFETYYSPAGRIVKPPFNFPNLYKIFEEGDVLAECVDAMQQNVDGFGYQLMYTGEDYDLQNDKLAQQEKIKATNFFNRVNEEQSITTIRKRMRQDLEVLGNGSFEIIRNRFGEPALMYYLPFRRIRMAMTDKKPVSVEVILPRNGKLIPIKIRKFFRRYCQISYLTGLKLKWFKEFGDPRILDAITGEFVDSKSSAKEVASEIWHFKIPFGDSAYGIPRWIQVVLDILGRRNSQYVNWDLFQSQGIPPLAILVSGGILTDASLQELEGVLRSMRGAEKWNRIMLLESNPESQGLEDKGSAKIELKPLAEYRKEDQMFTKYLIDAAESIRHRYRLPPLHVGWASSFTHACHDMSTETLTENGWKLFDDILPTDRIGTIDPDTHYLEYHIPEEVHVYPSPGTMIHIETRGMDIMVTPNHDLYFQRQSTNHPLWEKAHADEIMSGKYRKKFRALVSPEGFDDGESPEDLPIDNLKLFLGFLGAAVSDAHITRQGNDIVWSCKKQRKIKRYRRIAKKMASAIGGEFIEVLRPRGERGVWTEIRIRSSILREWCLANILTDERDKKLPNWAINLSKDDTEDLLDSLVFGDGCVVGRGPNSQVYVTTSKILADQVQILSFRAGYRTRIVSVEDERPNRIVCYYVNMTATNTLEFSIDSMKIENYSGQVYCFRVKNHLFVTRRNGKIAIHGNTSKSAKEVAEEQIFIPERADFDEPMNSKFLPILGITKWWFKSKGPQIVGSEELSQGVSTFGQAGAFTVNHAIKMANTAFGLEMSTFKEKWADYPFTMVMKLLEAGRLSDLQAIAEEGQETQAPQLQLPFKQNQTPIEEVMKSDLLSDEEKVLYKRLRGIQSMIEGIEK